MEQGGLLKRGPVAFLLLLVSLLLLGWCGPLRLSKLDESLPDGRNLLAVQVGATVSLPHSAVTLEMLGGTCVTLSGPLPDILRTDRAAAEMGLWSVNHDHFLCFYDKGAGNQSVRFRAAPAQSPSNQGDFGFGKGVRISLRPDVETSALWPLQAGVESLALPAGPYGAKEALRTVGLRAEDLTVTRDIPIIVVRSDDDLAVQLVNTNAGTCQLDTTPTRDPNKRLLCRTPTSLQGALAQLVIFSRSCVPKKVESTPSCTIQAHELEVGGATGTPSGEVSVQAPWLGWSAKVAPSGTARLWAITVKRSDVLEVQTAQVALMAGEGVVPWKLPPPGLMSLPTAAWVLGQVANFAIVSLLLGAALAARGHPAMVSAVLPSLAASSLALQSLSLLGRNQAIESILAELQAPVAWLVPLAGGKCILQAFLLMLALTLLHAFAVSRHLIQNGSGSAETLPHSLSFGSWELRALSFIAIPVGFASASWIVEYFYGRQGSILSAALGASILFSLLYLLNSIHRTLRTWFHDGQVIGIRYCDCTVYLDRVCDQLRCIPYQNDTLWLDSSWADTPAWFWAPTVAGLHQLEHQGSLDSDQTHGSWKAEWPAGPWYCAKNASAEPPPIAIKRGSSGLRNRSGSTSPRGARSTSKDFSSSPRGQSRAVQESSSALILAHPVTVTTRFVYHANVNSGRIAGAVGVPWLDAVVPASKLLLLEAILGGEVHLRVQAIQLAGPLTTGRLSACFDWSDRYPWRWLLDLLLRLLIASYVAALPALPTTGVWATVLHGTAVCGPLVLSVAALVGRLHNHLYDNLAFASALAFVGIAAGTRLLGPKAPDWIGVVLLVLALYPTVQMLYASFVIVVFALRSQEQVVRQASQTSPSFVREPDSLRTFDVMASEESLRRDFNSTISEQAVDVVLLAPKTCAEELKDVQVVLPGEVCSSMVVRRTCIDPHVRKSGGLPRLPVPVELFFSPVGSRRHWELSAVEPVAGVLTSRGGKLFYKDKDHNGFQSVNQVLLNLLDEYPREVEKVEDMINEQMQLGSQGSHRELLLIEAPDLVLRAI